MSVLDFKTAGEKNLKNFMKGQQSTKNLIDITIITLNKTLSLGELFSKLNVLFKVIFGQK